MKQIRNRFSILTITLIFSISAISACSASDKSTNGKASAGGTEQIKSMTADKKQAETKTSEETSQTKSVEIYDGRQEEMKSSKPSSKDVEFAENAIKDQEAEIKKAAEKVAADCKIKPEVTTVLEGSFTTPNASQKAYAYSLCSVGASDFVTGLMIAENAKVIGNYLSDGLSGFELRALPDINKNGLSEFAVITEDGGQGLRVRGLYIVEFKSGNLDSLGATTVWSVNFTSEAPSPETTYRISVEPSANPTFFRESFEKKVGAKDWTADKKSEKFSLETKSTMEFIKIN